MENQLKRARNKDGKFIEWEKCSVCSKKLGVGLSENGEMVMTSGAFWSFSESGDYLCKKCKEKKA